MRFPLLSKFGESGQHANLPRPRAAERLLEVRRGKLPMTSSWSEPGAVSRARPGAPAGAACRAWVQETREVPIPGSETEPLMVLP
jgi:hypothetical protein